MKRMVTMCAFVGLIAGGVSASAITGDQPEFRKLAEDVYAYIGKLNDSNAMAIVTTEGVVIVDTGNNTTDTRELLKHVQSVTKQPVRYVVITQNHNDHSGGAALFRRVARERSSLLKSVMMATSTLPVQPKVKSPDMAIIGPISRQRSGSPTSPSPSVV